ncbi:FHA domain-containing protein [Tundrisphaera lichenicola]|uniref:FHA domain-containing protein n=1 Tax=Tundrisphaera lichenicola TaxID=2029860 RepID=UPI003EBD5655
MSSTSNGHGWALEVVRGKDGGRVFALSLGEIVLGNAPADARGIDLADQESPGSPRRMAARHASVEIFDNSLALRDLESPGGTFVNRKRVLPGRSEPLRDGDVIQLGGVQLRVVSKSSAAPKPAPPPGGPFSYAIAGGTTCRTWDDFLTASSQRWESVREELTSGRLAAFLESIGRGDLAPSPASPGKPDDRLDAWLGSLPTSKPARPELEVHPTRLVVRVAPGGGLVRKTVRVSNVGHRLLRSTARIEPPGLAWLAIAHEFAGRNFATIEGTDLTVEVTIPESLPAPLKAELVIEGNGGSKRVAVVLEAKATTPEGTPNEPAVASGATWSELIARQSPVARVATWGLVALALRLLVGVAGGSIGEDAMTASGPDSPGLAGVALALALIGAMAGAGLASYRGGAREALPGGFAGGCAGVIASTGLVAICRSIEPILGSWANSIVAVCLLWAILGAGLAGLSTMVVKGAK